MKKLYRWVGIGLIVAYGLAGWNGWEFVGAASSRPSGPPGTRPAGGGFYGFRGGK